MKETGDISELRACLSLIRTLKRLALKYEVSANEYPKYADSDRREAARLRNDARWWLRYARNMRAVRIRTRTQPASEPVAVWRESEAA